MVPLLWLAALVLALGTAAPRLDDILDPDLLPAGLLLLDDPAGDANVSRLAGGDFGGALHTMGFHRRMMNEYLCRSYVAGQILGDVMASAAPRAERRVGSAAPEDADEELDQEEEEEEDLKRDKGSGAGSLKDSLLMDQGSSSYKKWLARSKSLEDSYRQLDEQAAGEEQAAGGGGDYDGVVTGFAYSRPFSPGLEGGGRPTEDSYPVASLAGPVYSGRDGGSSYGGSSYGGGGGGSSYGGGGGGGGYGGGGGGGGGYGGGGHPAKADKGGPSKSDIMDMAMTAMAFMAFAMFKMNVVMSIMDCLMSTEAPAPAAAPAPAPAPMVMVMPPVSVPSPGGGMFMLPNFPMGGGGGGMMMGGGGGGMLGGGGMGGGGGGLNLGGDGGLNLGDLNLSLPMGGMMMQRLRRSAPSDVAQLDSVARRALLSLEAFHSAGRDGARCLRRWLCDNNRFSRRLQPRHAAWLPLWSFGLSWAAGRGRSLENVHAAVLGLGAARCDRQFPGCPPGALAAHRRRRRRRRGDHAR